MSGVLVTGGTGKTGKTLVHVLRNAGVHARVASRNPAAADPDAIRFDWNDPTTYGPALDGMDRVFLLPPVESVDPLPLVEPFLRQAQRAGIRRLVMLGSAIVLPNAPSAVEMAARFAGTARRCRTPRVWLHAEFPAPAPTGRVHPSTR
ncbi:NAD(P)H-binding protein [Streptomyces sp. PDY-4]|uniref:NAD(P)H-binding protein n=1 Tax=Streptomyces sp. PDY-4 TaxID=3376070 RepID=UPI0037A934E4